MRKGKKINKDQFTFHFHLSDVTETKSVEGRTQEQLSDFEFHLRQVLKQSLDRAQMALIEKLIGTDKIQEFKNSIVTPDIIKTSAKNSRK